MISSVGNFTHSINLPSMKRKAIIVLFNLLNLTNTYYARLHLLGMQIQGSTSPCPHRDERVHQREEQIQKYRTVFQGR